MEDNFAKACKEIVEILKFVPDKDVLKIPKEMRKMFEDEMDKNYNFSIDTQKTIEEQELLNETKAILSNIFVDYWATPYQRERIIEKQNYERKVIEQQKSEKYNPNNIFKKISTFEIKETVNKNTPDNSNLPVDVKKEKFYQKIVNFIKRRDTMNFVNVDEVVNVNGCQLGCQWGRGYLTQTNKKSVKKLRPY